MGPLRKRTRSHQKGGLTSLTIDCKRLPRDLSHLSWHCNLQSCIMLEECLVHIRDTYLAAATSSKKQVFFKKMFHGPSRDARSLHASPANNPKMSVAASLAASTAVPSDPGSPNLSSLPSPVAQSKALAPEGLSSRLKKAFDDVVESHVGTTPDEMSTEAQAALNKISQPQVPQQVERDGFESQLKLAISSGTVDPKSAFAQMHAKLGTR